MDIADIKFLPDSAQMALAAELIEKDWQPVWCSFWPGGKFSPAERTTGNVPYPTVVPPPAGARKLGFRCPPNVVVIDVDAYDGKHGDESLARAERWLGDLPPTWRITSRGYSNESGRYLYRKPEDLDFSESALWQFREDGEEFGIEILRTTHRFSWAAGEIHYKTNQLILCYDELGAVCEMPYVHELPELPQRWVDYLRNPPVPQGQHAYDRPADGPQWWLQQGDETLSTDEELKGFAWDMLLSRVPVEDIWEQWQRVARSADPGWPWDRKDFDRHVRSRALGKVDEILAHEDHEWSSAAQLAGGEDKLWEKHEAAKREAEAPRELRAIVEDLMPADPEAVQQVADAVQQLGLIQAQPVWEQVVRRNPKYDEMLYREAAKALISRDVRLLMADEFTGWADISALPEPEAPAFLSVTGRGHLISPGTVTVISGSRASGKTWAMATWAAQELRAGGHVIWIDFERQAHLLASKFRALRVSPHIVSSQVHYVSARLPEADRVTAEIQDYRDKGNGRVLLVVDAFRGLQGTLMPGTSANDGDAVENVYLQYLNPATEAGATVAVIDHITKTGVGGTFGSERKESAADYVIKAVQQKPFSRSQAGYSTLEVTKDRYGHHAAGTIAAALWVPGPEGGKRTPSPLPDDVLSIKEYPDIPELRSWCPDGDGRLEQFTDGATAVKSFAQSAEDKLARENAIIATVHANPLKFGLNALAKATAASYPETFGTWEAAKAFIQKMKGKQITTDGAGKYEIVAGFAPGAQEQKADPAKLEHPDGEEVSE